MMGGSTKGPWTYRCVKRGGNGAKQIRLIFRVNDGQLDEMFVSRWYPPWQNGLMEKNARCIVKDLNTAFLDRVEKAPIKGDQ